MPSATGTRHDHASAVGGAERDDLGRGAVTPAGIAFHGGLLSSVDAGLRPARGHAARGTRSGPGPSDHVTTATDTTAV